MYFAILRTKKLKAVEDIKTASNHNSRKSDTPNANPSIKNIILVNGGPNVYQTVQNLISEAGAPVRKNSVLAQEIFLSASPEFFWVSDSKGGYGEWNWNKVVSWYQPAYSWLLETFGDNIVDCRLHLDEATPHIHAIVVPLTEDGRLAAYQIFTRETLQRMQDSYAQKLSYLGLTRGIPESRARHENIKHYYKNIAEAERMFQERPKVPCPAPGMSEEQCQKFADEQNEIFSKKLAPVFQMASHTLLATKKQKAYQKRCAELSKELEPLHSITGPPTMDFQFILDSFCLEPDPLNPQWWIGGGRKLCVDFENKEFLDARNEFRGAGLLDLVRYLSNGNHKDALYWIAAQKGVSEVHRCLVNELEKSLTNDDAGGNQPKDLLVDFRLPKIDGHREVLEKFLIHLGLAPEVTGPLLDEQKIYASRINGTLMAVFLCRNAFDPTGAELVGITEEFSGMHIFSDRYKGAFSIGKWDEKRIVVCQDAIDALSYKQLHPDDHGLIISSAGMTQYPPFIDDLIEENWDVQISFGNQEVGQTFAKKIQQRLPVVDLVFPDRESWHAVLTGTNADSPSPRS
jgi:hypothetical protein